MLASLEAAKVAASEATRVIAAHPDIDGSALAGAIWWMLNNQAELLDALRRFTSDAPSPPATSCIDDVLAMDLPAGWDEPRDWLDKARRWRGKRR